MSRKRITLGRSVGVGGRIFGSVFFLVFLGMGLLFCVFIVRDFYLGAKTYGWTPTGCVILESRVEEEAKSEQPYRFAVRYEYSWQGGAYGSEKLSRNSSGYSDYEEAQRLVARYPLDSKATCYVNPSNPSEALLERPGLWMGLLIFLPLIFVAVGGIGLVAMWSRTGQEDEASNDPPGPISSTASKGKGVKASVAFFLFFFAVGAVAFYFITLRPLSNVLAARSWVPTPCTIISSRVQSHSSDDGTTYRVDILYRYEVEGQEHRSNRYHFMGGSSSGYKAKAAIVALYPVGARRTCYVNPQQPAKAVLERGLTRDMWFGAIPAVFMLVGLGGTIGILRPKGKAKGKEFPMRDPGTIPIRDITGVTSFRSALATGVEETSGPRVLKPASSRVAGMIALGVFALIWNGILYFAFLRESGFFRRGSGSTFDWIQLLFMLPFLAVGLVLIGVVIYQGLTLCNPKAELTLLPGAPALGERVEITWRLTGRTQVLRDLAIFVEAREEATYRRGTRTTTDKKTFLKLEVASAGDKAGMSEGRASVTLPVDTMPSFQTDNNKIIWSLKIAGEISRWPDLKEEFVIDVRPAVISPNS